MINNEKETFFASIYNEQNWGGFAHCFEDIDIPLEFGKLIPDDVIRALIRILGEDNAREWIEIKLKSVDFKTAIELSKTEQGLKALKAFVMRLPC